MIKLNENIWKRSPENAKPGSEIFYDGEGVKLVNYKIGYDRELFPIVQDINQVRDYFRTNYAVNKIGLIECDHVTVSDVKGVKTVSKRSQPKMPNWYMGSITLPQKKVSYVITLYSEETDDKREREAGVLAEFMKQDNLELDAQGLPKDWTHDPYAKEYFGPSLYNVSDNEYYDRDYPEHALSRLRKRLDELANTIELPVNDVFEGNSWWKIWSSKAGK